MLANPSLPIPSVPVYQLQLTLPDVQVVLNQLMLLPWGQVNPLVQAIAAQTAEQDRQRAASAT